MEHYGAGVDGVRSKVSSSKRFSIIQSVVDPGSTCMGKDELRERERERERERMSFVLFYTACSLTKLLLESLEWMVGESTRPVSLSSRALILENEAPLSVDLSVCVCVHVKHIYNQNNYHKPCPCVKLQMCSIEENILH